MSDLPETDDRHPADQLDQRAGDAWSPRQIAFHLEGSLYYAESVGNLRA